MNTEVRVAKRGPKPKKAPDLRRIQEALDRGVKHGTSLYTKGCRCDVCREAVVAAGRKGATACSGAQGALRAASRWKAECGVEFRKGRFKVKKVVAEVLLVPFVLGVVILAVLVATAGTVSDLMSDQK
jgi:hypothetical protein